MHRADKLATVVLGFLIATSAAPHASALTLYSADAFSGFAGGASDSNSPTPVSVTGDIPLTGFGGNVLGQAASSEGHLGVALKLFDSPGVGVTAIFQTDVVFAPTAGSTLTTIPIQLNLNISGGSTHAGFSYHMEWNLHGAIGDALDFAIGSAIEGDTVEGDISSHHASGIASASGGETLGGGSDTVAEALTTDSVVVPVGLPVTIAVQIDLGGFGSGTAIGGFLDSVDFPATNVFTLPDGFTANDPDMFIVNNNFVVPGGSVPEPGPLLLLVSAVSAWLGCRRFCLRLS